MYTKATKKDIECMNEKFHSIPETRGELTIKTDSFVVEISWMAITVYDWAGTNISIDVSGRGDGRDFADIDIRVVREGLTITMPYPSHSVSFPLKSIQSITWAYPHEEGWTRLDIFKREQL